MRAYGLKIFSFLFVLFIMDGNLFLHSFVHTEFLFIGLLVVALHAPLGTALLMSVLFGMAKDALLFNPVPYSAVIFLTVSLVVQYLLRYVKRRKILVYAAASLGIFVYILLCNIYAQAVSLGFSLSFLAESIIIFFIINLLIRIWIPDFSRG